MASGLLDIERRVELTAIESLKTWVDLTNLLADGANSIVQMGDCDEEGEFPACYAEGINVAEFGHTSGNYVGGLRVGGLTYMDDDINQKKVKAILGAIRSWAQQSGLMTILNNTVSSQTAGAEVWFFAVELDPYGDGASPAYIQKSSKGDRWYEGTMEIYIVCMPSRPT